MIGDWRLPSIVDLLGIVDEGASGCGTGSPCINPTFGPTQAAFYWSATTRSDFTPNAWGVNFDGGGLLNLGKTEFHYVRAVRYGS